VDVPSGSDGILMLYRLRAATADATLDGRPVPTSDLAFGFTSVRVPAGRHELRLRPPSRWVKMGATVSALSTLVLLLLARPVQKGNS
jgi:hypothetical protein